MAGSQRRFDAEGHELTWDIFENAYVTIDYWEWVNGRGKSTQQVATEQSAAGSATTD